MVDIKNAYEILGLKEDAGKEEIIKRYNILCKKYKSQGNSATENQVSFDDISRAYNLLMGYEPESDLSGETEKKPNVFLKKLNVDEKKLNNFLYYHKFHIIIGAVLLIFVVYLIKTVVGYVEPDLKIALVGNFAFQGANTLEDKIYGSMKGLKKAQVDLVINWDKNDFNLQSAMEVKRSTLALQGNVDIYLLDRENFDFLADKGVLKSLDSLSSDTGSSDLKDKECRAKSKQEQIEHIYGFNVSESSLVKDLILPGSMVIAALGNDGKNNEKALELIHLLTGKSK